MFEFHIYFYVVYEPVLQRWTVNAEGTVFAERAFWEWARGFYGMRSAFIDIESIEVPPLNEWHPDDPSNDEDLPF